jgi:hypothetical protein
VWPIPLLCLQWKTPDNGQRNCPKHVECYSKNKFEKLICLVGFIVRNYHVARSPESQICCGIFLAFIVQIYVPFVTQTVYRIYGLRIRLSLVKSKYPIHKGFILKILLLLILVWSWTGFVAYPWQTEWCVDDFDDIVMMMMMMMIMPIKFEICFLFFSAVLPIHYR